MNAMSATPAKTIPSNNPWEVKPPSAPTFVHANYASGKSRSVVKPVDATFNINVDQLSLSSDEKVYLAQAVGSKQFSASANQYEKPVLVRLLDLVRAEKGGDWIDVRVTAVTGSQVTTVARKSVESHVGDEMSPYCKYLEDYKAYLKFMKGFDKSEDKSLRDDLRAANDMAAASRKKISKPEPTKPDPTSKRSLAKVARAAKKAEEKAAALKIEADKKAEKERLAQLKREADAVHEKKIVELAANLKLQQTENQVAKVAAARSHLIAKTDLAVEPALDIDAGWKLTLRHKKKKMETVTAPVILKKGQRTMPGTTQKQTVLV